MSDHIFAECAVLTRRLCTDCLKTWLNRKPPKGTWRELEAAKLEERLQGDRAEDDAQFEAGHA